MLPLRDDARAGRFPLVVLLIVVANIAVFYFQLRIGFRFGPDVVENFVLKYALIPVRDYRETTFPGNLFWVLGHVRPYFTSMFMHGGFFHILFNLWSFWIFGDNVEASMGRLRFLFFYLLCGVIAALTHVYFNPYSEIPVVGASGAIAGVMGAYLISFPRARLKMITLLIFWPIVFEIPAFLFLILWFIGQLLSSAEAAQLAAQAGEAAGDVGGIAFSAHIGGFLAGMVLIPFFRQKGKMAKVARRVSQ